MAIAVRVLLLLLPADRGVAEVETRTSRFVREGKAKEYEQDKNGKKFTWVDGKTLDDIVDQPLRDLPVIDEAEGCAICHL